MSASTLTEQELYARSTKSSQFSAARVQKELDALATTNIVENIEKWMAMDKAGPGGRRPALTVQALLVAILMLQDEHAPLLKTEISNVFYRRLTDDARELLGISHLKRAKSWKKESDDWYFRVDRCFTRMVSTIDPKPAARRMMNTQERHYQESLRDEEESLIKEARLRWFCDALLEMSVREIPEEALSTWKGDISIDQTRVPAVSQKGRSSWERKNGKGTTPEPDSVLMELDADWYNHAPEFHNVDSPNARDYTWAYTANLAVMTLNEPTDDDSKPVPHPQLVIGMAFATPIRSNITDDTVAMLNSIVSRGHPAGRATGDKEYFAKYPAAKLALPARALGYSPMTDYYVGKQGALGVNGHVGGAIQVEGKHYCPSMPANLINASKRLRADEISRETYLRQVEEIRPQYEVQRKELPDEDGAYPVRCPALGLAPTLVCPLRELNPKAAKRERREVTPPEMPDAICTKSSVTIRPTEDMRYLQDIRYGTREWERKYAADRNTIERMNGIVKDETKEDLGNAAGRRSRGFTAAAVFTAVKLVSANRRMTRTWLRNEAERAAGAQPARRPRRAFASLKNHKPRLPMLNADGTITMSESQAG